MTDTTLFDAARPNPHGFRELTVAELDGKTADVRLIDVREPDEFVGELGHLPGAELVPLAGVPQASAAWDREQTLVMVCRSGGRSGQAAEFLVRQGFPRVVNLVGGMLAVQQAGLPTER